MIMTGFAGFSPQEVRELVHEYQLQPHGTKVRWLAERQISSSWFQRARRAVYEGDVDRNLLPRDHGGVVRSRGEWSAFEKARALEIAAHEAEVELLQARVRELEGTVDVLGKAIGLLHELNGQEPDTFATETNERNGSL
jgi:hypothetical protein